MRSAGSSERIGEEEYIQDFGGKPKGKRLLRKHRHRR
jgi:hypothetical protein